MKLFYHHVGQEGSARDFPKTVFQTVSRETVARAVADHPAGPELLSQLDAKFPEGQFNVWGVPSGAAGIMKRLDVGDIVLLLESRVFVAAAEVEVFVKEGFNLLARELWDDERYLWVFFFRTRPILFPWGDFLDHAGYSDNYTARGKFLSVSAEKTTAMGGAHAYLKRLETEYSTANHPFIAEPGGSEPGSETPVTLRDLPSFTKPVGIDDSDLDTEERVLAQESAEQTLDVDLSKPPQPRAETGKTTTHVRRARHRGFSSVIRAQYDYACAVCGLSLMTADGRPEVEGAHIKAVAHEGPDDPRNGLALCRTHHWAFDNGLFGVSDTYEIIVRTDCENGKLTRFRGTPISLPDDHRAQPHVPFLVWHRQHHGLE